MFFPPLTLYNDILAYLVARGKKILFRFYQEIATACDASLTMTNKLYNPVKILYTHSEHMIFIEQGVFI
jgi:hypothetical protein